jgi:hypothetical protein
MVRKFVLWYLVVAMFIIGVAPRLEAAFAPSEALVLSSARSADLATVQAILENKLISQRLQDLGFSADEISARLSQLSDQQIHSIAQKLDDLKVGADGGTGLVIAILLIIVIVLLIINLTGHKVVVTR